MSEFLRQASEDATDPVYGQTYMKREKSVTVNDVNVTSNSVPAPRSAESGLSPAGGRSDTAARGAYARPETPCVICGASHRLWHCDKFKKMAPTARLELVNRHQLCHNCLRDKHTADICGKKSVCFVDGCGEKHTMYLHISKPKAEQSGASRSPSGGNNVNPQTANSNTTASNAESAADGAARVNVTNAGTSVHSACYMPVVRVQVNKTEWAYAVLDTASSNTFCTESLVQRLGLCGHTENYHLSTISDSTEKTSTSVSFSVTSTEGRHANLSGVFVVGQIPVSSAPIDVSQYEHLQDLDFPYRDGIDRVDILIGQDYSDLLLPLEVRRGKPGEPYAFRSMMGWCLNGRSNAGRIKRSVVSNFVSTLPVTDHNAASIHEDVCRLWAIEDEGVEAVGLSQEDKSVIDLWDNSCRKDGLHYELPIPWKDPSEPLPNNISVAKSRLFSLVKKLNRENNLDRYEAEIDKLLSNGYAEEVPPDEIDIESNRIWYLPHSGVITEKKPGKLRVVYDCASKYAGKSLNDRCLQGPDLVNKLLFVLLRFRQHVYAVQADVEAMYNQIRIPVSDRDALRFLWLRDGKIVHYRMTSHLFGGVWCASSSTYALRRTVQDYGDVDPLIRDAVERSMYVDDCLKSVISEHEVKLLVSGVPEVLKSGGFNLTKFIVNDSSLLHEVPLEHRAKEVHDFTPESTGKVLGVKWKISADMFHFELSEIPDHDVTRRKILSIVSSIYDPLGLIGPLLLPGKLIFQDATRLKLAWDEIVPDAIASKWKQWLVSLREIVQLQFPRCVKPLEFDHDSEYELHCFADASAHAYGAAVYLRCINKAGKINTQLLLSKNKVAPLKQTTIPRLELQAAVLAAKLYVMVRVELDIHIDQAYLWSDSQVVLSYIRNTTRRFHVFVENRVSKIRQLTSVEMWNHVGSIDNPADLLTRAKSIPLSVMGDMWVHGPAWLNAYKHQWPVQDASSDIPRDDPEVKVCISHSTSVSKTDPLYHIAMHYSQWYRMQRAVAWLRRCVNAKSRGIGNSLGISEIRKSKLSLIKNAQGRYYPDEMDKLARGHEVNKSSSIRNLCPYLDADGLMRVGGRTGAHPYIIPHSHPIAKAIVLDYHIRAHVGVEWTLALIRQEYWLVKARPLVKKVVHECVRCRKLYAKPGAQKMADLPIERIRPKICQCSHMWA